MKYLRNIPISVNLTADFIEHLKSIPLDEQTLIDLGFEFSGPSLQFKVDNLVITYSYPTEKPVLSLYNTEKTSYTYLIGSPSLCNLLYVLESIKNDDVIGMVLDWIDSIQY